MRCTRFFRIVMLMLGVLSGFWLPGTRILLAQSPEAGIVLGHLDQHDQEQFKNVTRFGLLDVRITGAPDVGTAPRHPPLPDREELTKVLLEQYAGDFSGIAFRPLSQDSLRYFTRTDSTAGEQIGFLMVQVHLQAVSVDLAGIGDYLLYQVTVLAGPLHAMSHWQQSTSGICAREELATCVRREMQGLVDDLAIDFFKGKGEM